MSFSVPKVCVVLIYFTIEPNIYVYIGDSKWELNVTRTLKIFAQKYVNLLPEGRCLIFINWLMSGDTDDYNMRELKEMYFVNYVAYTVWNWHENCIIPCA